MTLGAFRLSSDQVSKINKFEPLRRRGRARRPAGGPPNGAAVHNGRFYEGANPGEPDVGDVSIEFQQVLPTEVSLLAQQVGSSFRPYQTKSGDAINRLQLG